MTKSAVDLLLEESGPSADNFIFKAILVYMGRIIPSFRVSTMEEEKEWKYDD
jgi:hypothetical protein